MAPSILCFILHPFLMLSSIFSHHEKEGACRKYIDLIYRASSAFPNWDPSRKVEPGDFGLLNRKTGQFEKEGNIFRHEVCAAIAASYPVLFGEVKTCKNIISTNAKDHGYEVSPHASIAGLAEAYIKAKIHFDGRRGAALLIHRPQTLYLNPELIAKIEEDDRCIELLKRKLMITDVFQASSYAMYLSSRQAESIEIALLADVPVPHVPGINVGGRVGGKWFCSSVQGTFENAHNPSGNFYPLYIHKQLKWKGRRENPDPDGHDPGFGFMHSDLPWNPLKEDGEEMTFESDSDEVSSDEASGTEL